MVVIIWFLNVLYTLFYVQKEVYEIRIQFNFSDDVVFKL